MKPLLSKKGGENVQVSGIGLTGSTEIAGNNSPVSKGTNFLGLFGLLLNNSNKTNEVKSTNDPGSSLSSQNLNGLIDFLKTNDFLDLNGGSQLLGKETGTYDNELLSTITSFLGLKAQDLKDILANLKLSLSENNIQNMKETRLKSGKENLSNLGDKILPIEETASKETPSTSLTLIEDIMACLNQLITLPNQNLPKFINQDFQEISKVAKMYELLTKNMDHSGVKDQLSQLINQTVQKLETLANQSNQGNNDGRVTYLQNVYRSLSNDLKSSNQSSQEKEPLSVKTDPNSGMIQFQQMSKPEQLAIMLKENGKPVSANQFIQQFENVLSKSQFSNTNGTQTLLVKLNPEDLGSLRIELTQKDSVIVAKIVTTTGAAKDVLESQIQGLKAAFQSQNLPVDRIEVTQTAMDQQERFFQRDQQQEGRSYQEQSSKQNKDEKDSNYSFEDALLNMEV